MAYPTSLDSFPTAVDLSDDNLDTKPHSTLHGNLGVSVAALEAKVGVDSSAVTTSHDYKFAQLATTYQPLDSDLTAIAALTTTSYGRAFLALADAAAGRTALGLGTAATSASTDFQSVDSDLTAIAALSTTSFGRSLLTAATAAAAATLIGVGTGDSPQFTAIEVGAATDTTLARASAGVLQVEGNRLFAVGGTDVPVADGGTGASTAAGAATNLGLGTGDSPQFTAVNVGDASDTTITRASAGVIAVEGKNAYLVGGTDVAVTDGGTGSSTAAGAATALGLGTGDSPQLTAVNIGHATDTTLDRASAGVLQVEGNRIFAVGGTDVPIADGGTGASVAATALSNLGGVPLSTVTAAGDTIIATGSGTITNLAIGTAAGKALVADPNATNKISVNFPQGVGEATYGAAGSLAATFPRWNLTSVTLAILTTQKLYMVGICLPKGITVTNLTWYSGTTGAGTSTNCWSALFDSSRNKLAISADDTNASPWSASTAKVFAMGTPYVVPTAGWYYAGVMVKATTVPTIEGNNDAGTASTAARTAAPVIAGQSSDTGLTNPASCPNPAGALTVQVGLAYVEVS